MGLFEDSTENDWRSQFEVNVMGVVNFMRAVLREMRKRRGGSIINNSSIGGISAAPYFSAYDASKFAVVAVTKCVALEVGEDKIRVNAVCPGPIETDMMPVMLDYFEKLTGQTREEIAKEAAAAPALRRNGKPEEVAAAVAFLASDDASYITGITMPIAGGYWPGI
jgi:NAD(P)-dependent dehydrogenase (short-subunit alcohol dehydrogenase family)